MNPRTLSRTTWKTAISGRVERFAGVIADQAVFEKYFGEPYVERISAKVDRIFRSELIVGIAFAILMASLFAAQDAKKAEFEIFGYGFKNVGYHKEILLLLAALLSPIATVLSAYRRYLIAIRNECLKKLVPDPKVRTFYSQLHVDDYFDAVMRDPSSTAPRALTVFLSATFGLVGLLLMLAFFIASFLLQVSVFYDVATNPASSKYVNAFVITLSLTSIALSWVIALLQLPLPEINPAFYTRLSELKANDKAKYEEEMRASIAESARRERLLFSVASLMIFMLSYATISTIWYPNAQDELGRFITSAFLGSLLAVAVGDAAASMIKKACYRWFFRTYPTESERRLKMYIRLGKVIAVLRIVLVLALAAVYSVLTLRS